LHEEGKLWIAYPKAASKIASDLNRDCTWECICEQGFECVRTVPLDHVWTAIRFQRREPEPILNRIHVAEEVVGVKKRTQTLPEDMETLFTLHPKAKDFFGSLPAANRKEYVLPADVSALAPRPGRGFAIFILHECPHSRRIRTWRAREANGERLYLSSAQNRCIRRHASSSAAFDVA